MRIRSLLSAFLFGAVACSPAAPSQSRASTTTRETPTQAAAPRVAVRREIGFRSRKQLDDHFTKHGREFGGISKQEYLREAQELRDGPAGGAVEELVRPDGTTSRFDRQSGAFIAFNRDETIRTFFKPNDGENYFRRQAGRSH